MSQWRAGAGCPLEGCSFQFMVASDDEAELDLVGTAIMDAHSKHSHGDMPVTLFGARVNEITLDEPGVEDGDIQPEALDAEERPRLLN